MSGTSPLLVTGGAGFIGSNFVRRAIDAGWFVVNLDALTYAGNLRSLVDAEDSPNYQFQHGNICDGELVYGLLSRVRPRAVINFAAESHVDRSIERPGAFIETNVLGTQRLLTYVLAYWQGLSAEEQYAFRYLQVSTDEVYGSISVGHASEETPYAPNSPYAASKAGGDHLTRAFHVTYGLPTITTCSSNNYGPYQFPEKLIPLAILKAQSDEPIPIYGDGQQTRDWIHVFDNCDALLGLVDEGQPGRTYNIGGSNERTNLELVREICRRLERIAPSPLGRPFDALISFVSDRPGHDRRYALSSERLQRELGWRPKIDFAKGLSETISWYLENSVWVDDIRQHRYGGERLGLGAAR
jgi:dTDP-glucose 4,6-dehydratase